MASAINAVRSNKIGLEKKTVEVFAVARSTLRDKVNSKEADIEKLSVPTWSATGVVL